MEQYIIDDLLERVDDLINIMDEHEELFYISIEVAHQLRDEISQTEIVETDSDE